MMRPLLPAALALALTAGGCRKVPEGARAEARGSATETAADAGAPAISEADARALVEAWLAAQNQGNFGAYEALYARKFSGVKRSGDRIVRMNRAEWLADRKRMFARPMLVEAAELRVVASRSGVTVGFEQTWSSGAYKDTGPKVMVLSREGGAPRVEREELLASRKLLVDQPAAAGGGATALASDEPPARFATSFRGQAAWLVLGKGFDLDREETAVIAASQLIEQGIETTVIDSSLFAELDDADGYLVLVHGAFGTREQAEKRVAELRSRRVRVHAMYSGDRTNDKRLVRVIGQAEDPAGRTSSIPVTIRLEDANGSPVGTADSVTDLQGWYSEWIEIPASAVDVVVEGNFELDTEASEARGCHGWIDATLEVSRPVPALASEVALPPITPFEDCCGE